MKRTHASRLKKPQSQPIPQVKSLDRTQSTAPVAPAIQAKTNEEGLAEWKAQQEKWARFGMPWMNKAPNPAGELAQPWIQQKLTLGPPRDNFEQEADRVSSQIGVGETSSKLESAINSTRGEGQPLDSGLQQSMGQLMGADFSRVRVHTDARSDELNQSIRAKAFTTGQDVFFGKGTYQPKSKGGQELISHELAHVVQKMEK